jgi:hypothetical protein
MSESPGSENRKRAADAGESESNKTGRTGGLRAFETGTTEATWNAEENEDRKYIVRHVHGDTCCESPWSDVDNWPTVVLPTGFMVENGDGEETDEPQCNPMHIVGAVWLESDKSLVGLWGQNPDDSHLEFYCIDSYEFIEEDLNGLTGVLCTEICPELIDCFDDGSGKDRDPMKVTEAVLRAHEGLTDYYKD